MAAPFSCAHPGRQSRDSHQFDSGLWQQGREDGIFYEDALELVASSLEASGVDFGQGTGSAAVEANWLVATGCSLPPADSSSHAGYQLSPDVWTWIVETLRERVETRQPMAYLLGHAWFAGYQFSVDNRALVPRSYFSEWIPDRFAPFIYPDGVHSILDLCCGCGCIGITAALAFPQAKVVLSDLSADALELAHENMERHDVADRVSVHLGNGFEGIDQCFDLILCNPPYVARHRMEALPPEYQAEPELGLMGGDDGLDFITPLLESAGRHLHPAGSLIVEAGSAGEAVLERWPAVPFCWLSTECEEPVLFMLNEAELAQHQFCMEDMRFPCTSATSRT